MKNRIPHSPRIFKRYGKILTMLVGGFLTAFSPVSQATLGGDINSILDDQTTFNATLQTTKIGAYTEYVLTLPDGGIVYETIGDSGLVFQVRWKGKGHRPNMEQLLGTFADRYSNQSKKSKPQERRFSKTEGDLVVQSSVRNRHFKGRAYIPSLVPTGFSIN